MNKMLDRSELMSVARDSIGHAQAREIVHAPGVLRLDATRYFDPDRFELEMARIFKRLPLMLAATAELPKPGDYKTMEVAGLPVLIVRAKDGVVRAFINSCSHRGAQVALQPSGNARRFVCPYHGWTFTQTGELMGVAMPQDFGEVDKSCLGLTRLPAHERSGLIWVVLDPNSTLPFDHFLSGYDRMLGHFGFEDWILFDKRTLEGPNWKIAYDGYLDFYHLPVLHKDTFGEDMFNQALYYAWGPHQLVRAPSEALAGLAEKSEADWDDADLLQGVWTIFPHISIASFDGGGRGVMLSQLLPGSHVGQSFTTQLYLMQNPPTDALRPEADAQFAFLEHVVRDEDYATGLRQQRALQAGGRKQVLFGENEGGAQRFHQWVDDVLAAEDEAALCALFGSSRS